jgi:hypothetical protein
MKALGGLTHKDLKVLRQIDQASEQANFYRNAAERSAFFAMNFWVIWSVQDGFFAEHKWAVVALLIAGMMWVTINQIRRNYWEPLIARLIVRDEDLKNRLAWPAGVPVVSQSAETGSTHAE